MIQTRGSNLRLLMAWSQTPKFVFWKKKQQLVQFLLNSTSFDAKTLFTKLVLAGFIFQTIAAMHLFWQSLSRIINLRIAFRFLLFPNNFSKTNCVFLILSPQDQKNMPRGFSCNVVLREQNFIVNWIFPKSIFSDLPKVINFMQMVPLPHIIRESFRPHS